jgi:hypothetical protein
MIGSPATASATHGTGPRADASTTPCFATNRSQRDPDLRAGARGGRRVFGLALARFTGFLLDFRFDFGGRLGFVFTGG